MLDIKKTFKMFWLPALWFFLDVLVFDTFIITMLVVFCMMIYMIPRLVYSFFKKKEKSREYGMEILLFICTIVVICFARYLNIELAEYRADKVINAVEKFKETEKRYPSKLDELVPKYINSIPNAKIGFMPQNKLCYSAISDSPMLYYYVIPPFARKIYYFGSKQWGFMD